MLLAAASAAAAAASMVGRTAAVDVTVDADAGQRLRTVVGERLDAARKPKPTITDAPTAGVDARCVDIHVSDCNPRVNSLTCKELGCGCADAPIEKWTYTRTPQNLDTTIVRSAQCTMSCTDVYDDPETPYSKLTCNNGFAATGSPTPPTLSPTTSSPTTRSPTTPRPTLTDIPGCSDLPVESLHECLFNTIDTCRAMGCCPEPRCGVSCDKTTDGRTVATCYTPRD